VLYGGSGGHRYDATALNDICVLSGGVGGHRYAVDALVELGAVLNQYPSVLDDGNTVAWYDYTAVDTITKDGSNFVSQWRSRIGTNHLNQAVGTNQPLLTNDGVLFDGVDNFMKTGAFTFNQPEFFYIVLNQKAWLDARYILDGISTNAAQLSQRAPTPEIRAFAGEIGNNVTGATVNTFVIVRLLINSNQSKLQVNALTPWAGNLGTINAGGITLCSRADGLLNSMGNIEFKELLARKVADNSTDETAIYNYLKKKYGL